MEGFDKEFGDLLEKHKIENVVFFSVVLEADGKAKSGYRLLGNSQVLIGGILNMFRQAPLVQEFMKHLLSAFGITLQIENIPGPPPAQPIPSVPGVKKGYES